MADEDEYEVSYGMNALRDAFEGKSFSLKRRNRPRQGKYDKSIPLRKDAFAENRKIFPVKDEDKKKED
jgi:hypothetical protein